MANPLQPGQMPPPAPVQTNAIGSGQPPSQNGMPQAGGPQAPPAPTHVQTVAVLRHLAALQQELTVLLKNPDLGKADMKSAIIDGVTKLVADRIVPPTAAVQKLATVPETPFKQKQWIEHDYAENMQARNAILAHHAAAFAGAPAQQAPDPENHMSDIKSAMQTHYSGQQ